MFITLLISLYTSRVILETLGITDFGIYNLVGGLVTMFSFLNSAMSTGTQRFLSYEMAQPNEGRLNKVFNMSINIHIVIALVIVLLAETFGLWLLEYKLVIPDDRSSAAAMVYQFSIATFVVSILSVPYNALIIAREKMKIYAYFSILEVALKLMIVYLLSINNWDKLIFYSLLMFGVSLFMRLTYYFYCRKNFRESVFKICWDPDLFKSMLGFNTWNLIGNLSSVCYNQGVSLVLNIFFGPVINAARGICLQLNGALNSFVSNLQTALNPQIIKSYARKDLREMHELIFLGSKLSFFLLLLVSLPIFVEMNYVLHLWLKNVPEYTVSFCRLILVVSLIDSYSGALGTAVLATSVVKYYHIIIGGLQLLILPISYVLLKMGYKADITLYVNIVFSFLMLGCRLRIASSLVQLPINKFFLQVILRMMAVCLMSGVLSFLILANLSEGRFRFAAIVVASSIMTIGITYIVGINSSQRIAINNKYKVFINRFKR